MVSANRQWRKAIAGILSAFTLLAIAGGLVSCGGVGEEQDNETQEQVNEDEENEDGEENNREDNDWTLLVLLSCQKRLLLSVESSLLYITPPATSLVFLWT